MGHISDPILDAAAHDNGGGDGGDNNLASIVGQTIVLPDGTYWTVSANPNPVANVAPGFFGNQGPGGGLPPSFRAEDLTVTNVATGESAPFTDIAAGKWVLQDRTEVVVDDKGNITSTRNLTAGQWNDYLSGAGGAGGGGGGGAGSGPSGPPQDSPAQSLNAAVNAARFQLEVWSEKIKVEGLPREQAIEEFNRVLNILDAQLSEAEARTKLADDINRNTLAREEARSDLGVEQNRLRRDATDTLFNDILPFSFAAPEGQITSSVNVPFLGQLGTTPLGNIDQLVGLNDINTIPSINPNLPAPIDPSAVGNINIPTAGPFPELPAFTPSPLPAFNV